MLITRRSLPRRAMLRGVGVALGLPMLDAMVPALAGAARAGAGRMRLGFFYVPNGIQVANFLPKNVSSGPVTEFGPILSPLSAVRGQTVVVAGLANRQADQLDIGTGPHSRSHMTWLSGTRPKRTEGADIQGATTLDQHAARVVGQDTPLLSLELALEPNFIVGNCEGGYACAYVNSTSWRTPTTPLPMETNPRAVFERLFGEDSHPGARTLQNRRDRSILDAVSADVARLGRALGPADRVMVDEYVDAIRDVERRLQKSERDAGLTATVTRPLGIPESFEDHAALMFDLQFLAYQADLTRVVTFQIARELSTRSYPVIGVPEAHHDVSHHGNNPDKVAKHTKINTHHVQLFARLVEKMRTTPDGDGSMLDHAILLYGAGMGDGNVHSPHNLPVALVGGGAGTLTGGRLLRAPLDTPMMNLGLSLLDKVGVEMAQLGDSTGRLTGL